MTTATLVCTAAPGEPGSIAELRAGYELLDAAYRETTRRYDLLRAAAQAAVIEARSSRRNPVTPVVEALAELDALPAPGARLLDLPLAAGAVWPRGTGVLS